jgi:hypothetical protein
MPHCSNANGCIPTMALVGLPPGSFDLPIFDVVLNAKTVRGSIVGTRKDMEEALMFAGEGKNAAHYLSIVGALTPPIFGVMAPLRPFISGAQTGLQECGSLNVFAIQNCAKTA